MTGLPSGWSTATLSDVAQWASGGTPQAGNPEYYGGSIPWAIIGDLNDSVVHVTKSTITDLGLVNSSARVVPPGTVMIAMYGSIGKLGIAGKPMATNQAIATAVLHDFMEPKYLFYFLMSQRRQLDAAGKGATQRNISQTVLRPWKIPLPGDRVAQRRIVEVLDDHLSRLDAAENLIQTASLRLETLLLSALTQSVTEMRRGGVPFRPLGSVTETTLGKMLDAKKGSGEPTRYLANINVRWGRFDLGRLKVVPLTAPERQRLRLRRGDILACEGGEPGRSAVWELDGSDIAYQKALHRIRVLDSDALSPHFVALMLREAIQSRRWDSLFTGTTIKHLPQEKLRRIEIPIPPIAAQRELQAHAQEVERQAGRQAEALEAAKRRSHALRRGLLTAAFAGSLTGRSTDDAVIEELVH